MMRNNSIIERDLRDLVIREHIVKDVRLADVIEDIHMFLDLQQVIVAVHPHRTIFESSGILIHHAPSSSITDQKFEG